MTEAARGHLAMLAFSALVAGSFALGVLAANEIAPAALTAVRFGIAAVLVGSLAAARGVIRRRDGRAAWRYLVLGGLFAIYFILMFEGLKTAPPVSAAAVFTLTPVMSAGFGWLLLRQVATGWIAFALSVGAVGALWVIFRADLGALRAFQVGRGEAIFFVGCIAHAVYTPLVRRLNRGEAVVSFTFGTLVGALIVTLVWGRNDLAATDWAALPPIVWITIIYVSTAATAVSFVLVQFATLRLPSSKVMAYTYLTPSWVILWQLGLGNAAPPGLILAGVGATVLALLMLLREPGGAGQGQRFQG